MIRHKKGLFYCPCPHCKGRIKEDIIHKKLDVIVRLTAFWATRGRSYEERESILKRLGFSGKEITKWLSLRPSMYS